MSERAKEREREREKERDRVCVSERDIIEEINREKEWKRRDYREEKDTDG